MNILKLKDQCEIEVALYMHKYVHKELPRSFNETFKHNHEIQVKYGTRRSSLLFIKRAHTNFVDNLPLFAFPKIWNKWKDHDNTNTSFSMFKKIIKNMLVSDYADNVRCMNLTGRQCN